MSVTDVYRTGIILDVLLGSTGTRIRLLTMEVARHYVLIMKVMEFVVNRLGLDYNE